LDRNLRAICQPGGALFAKKPEFDRKIGGVIWNEGDMMNFALLRPMMACVMVSGLAACGGGGGGSSSDTPVVTQDPPPNDIAIVPDTTTSGQRAAAVALLNEWAPSNPPVYTALSAIPTTGGAEYNGFIYGEFSNSSDEITDSMIGSLQLEVGFNAGGASFDGTADGFVDEDDNALTGRLTVSGGSLNRAGNPADDATVGVVLTGVLTDTAARDLAFSSVTLEGDFLGSANNAIGGAALGRVTVGGVDQDFDGGFIAEQ